MNAFWFLGSWTTGLRGLWSYRAATLGDGILLPLAVFSLASMLGILPAAPRSTFAAMLGGIVGLLGGLAVIASWKLDKSPELNWTMPHPGDFNAAGQYHALFLIAMATLLSGLLVSLASRLRFWGSRDIAKVSSLLHSPFPILFIGSGVGFLILVILDAQSSLSTFTTRISILSALLLVLVSAIMLFSAFGLQPHEGLFVAGLGLILGIGIGLVSVPLYTPRSIPPIVLFVLACAAISLTAEAYASDAELRWVRVAVTWLVYAGTLDLAVRRFDHSVPAILGVSAGGLVLASLASWWNLERHNIRPARIFLFAFLTPTITISAWAWSSSHPGANDRVAVLVSLVAITTFSFFIRLMSEHYDDLVESDRNPPPGVNIERKLWATWLVLGPCFIATLASALTLLQPLRGYLGIEVKETSQERFPLSLGLYVLTSCAIVAVTSLLFRFHSSHRRIAPYDRYSSLEDLGLPAYAMIGIVTGATISAVAPLTSTSRLHTSAPLANEPLWGLILMCAFVASISAIYIYESIYANTCSIQLISMSRACLIFVGMVSLINGVSIFRLLVRDIWATDALASMQTFYVVLFSLFGIMFSWIGCSWIISRSIRSLPANGRFISFRAPASGALNDSMLLSANLILWIFIFWVLFRDTSRAMQISIQALANVFSVMLIGYEAANFAIRNYATHFHSEECRRPEEGAQAMMHRARATGEDVHTMNAQRIERLEAHIRRHERIGITMSPCAPLFALRYLLRRFLLSS